MESYLVRVLDNMHACEWRAILWLPPWVSPSPYCPAGGKEAKQVNVAQHCSHTHCRVNCIAMQGGSQHKSLEHYCTACMRGATIAKQAQNITRGMGTDRCG